MKRTCKRIKRNHYIKKYDYIVDDFFPMSSIKNNKRLHELFNHDNASSRLSVPVIILPFLIIEIHMGNAENVETVLSQLENRINKKTFTQNETTQLSNNIAYAREIIKWWSLYEELPKTLLYSQPIKEI